jgi:exopolyphosphatase/guanosine-5'-triphosphate,3'-diphosphate pyrophosphatase
MNNQQPESAPLKSETLPKILKYAAIDIGSNAVRLLLCNAVDEHGEFHYKKGELLRIPIRLGEDVFQSGKVSAKMSNMLSKTMQSFKLLIDVFDPVAYRACATSALREAENGDEIIRQIRRESGLKVEIIPGRLEADLIFCNHVEEHLDKNKSYLYIDVGGGSTEITLFHKGQSIFSHSFNIGTIRWLKGKVSKELWTTFKEKMKEISDDHHPLMAIGSGGNINKIFKMLDRKDKPLTYTKLRELYDDLKAHTLEERMQIWGLNPDRADVIVPAAKIFLGTMKAAGIEEIIVPQIGLSDGIVHQLHEQYVRSMVA